MLTCIVRQLASRFILAKCSSTFLSSIIFGSFFFFSKLLLSSMCFPYVVPHESDSVPSHSLLDVASSSNSCGFCKTFLEAGSFVSPCVLETIRPKLLMFLSFHSGFSIFHAKYPPTLGGATFLRPLSATLKFLVIFATNFLRSSRWVSSTSVVSRAVWGKHENFPTKQSSPYVIFLTFFTVRHSPRPVKVSSVSVSNVDSAQNSHLHYPHLISSLFW